MRRFRYGFFCFILVQFVFVLSCKGPSKNKLDNHGTNFKYTSYVNPFIGTEGNGTRHFIGNVHPGAVRPWGMVSVSPQSFDFTKMQSPSGYRHEEKKIFGFSNVNFSGVGCPAAGSIPFKFFTRDLPSGYKGSTFSNQIAQPGYYSVKLDEESIVLHATTTKRSSLIKLELPKGSTKVYLDLTAQQAHVKGGVVENYTDSTASGYQLEGNFCGSANRSAVFFSTHLNKNADSTYLKYNNKSDTRFNQDLDDQPSGIVYVFNNTKPAELYIKVGVSYVSTTNAAQNLIKEQTGYDFEKVKEEAQEEWEKELGRIKVTGNSDDDKIVFYTALYHSLLMPMTYSDCNGEYVKMGTTEIGKSPYTRYTGFSFWDTYRTTHPLLTLVYPEKQEVFVKNMLDIYDESGWLPKWPIFNFEPYLMVGDPSPIVIGDSYTKGIKGFNVQKAYEAITKSANYEEGNLNRRGIKDYNLYGYITMDGEFSDVENFQWDNGIVWGAVSNTMEFNLSDYNIAQIAKLMGNEEDYIKYLKRSKSFMSLYNDEIGLLQPKNKDGSWYEPFDPTQELWDRMNFGLRGGPGFVEGSAWQYLFSIPHGIDTLKNRMGEEQFLKSLNTIFDKEYFDMTNEPGFGFPFFYNLTKEKNWKTAHTVHGLLKEHFPNAPNGLPGNDDAGAMSSWAVFAMMGLYPHTPGNPEYMVTAPVFDKIEIALNNDFYKGNQIVIERQGPVDGIIKSMRLGDKDVDYKVRHEPLTSDNKLLIIETENSESSQED
ncbi:GH92 family glycosyl hydrolase [Flagellimonas sp. 389]|uniref:GH92 family glycosyl hydrolase n=1 Tax=Flagellimonas sp. 389 TaxID=2835862 RepID=UPI001BD6899F|nr:GH92 family glycosyl hydrolase [Flagellimonas sp. 389]MBS9462576.1 GH92 family glycosyl hydrolase [Flagellimonas sp. 389]